MLVLVSQCVHAAETREGLVNAMEEKQLDTSAQLRFWLTKDADVVLRSLGANKTMTTNSLPGGREGPQRGASER